MESSLLLNENYKTYYSWQMFHELTSEQRKDLINFSVKQISKEKGLHFVDLVFKDMDSGSRGSCTPELGFLNELKGHTMTLNSDVLVSNSKTTPYSLYNTINHELEHAQQYERASDLSIGNDDAATLEQRLNDEHYYSAKGDRLITYNGKRIARFDCKTDYQLYRAQACEADARAAGLKSVEELKKFNESAGVYDEYIDNYIEYANANEINSNREMLERLGMHSRENMAREELSHISNERVSLEDRERVIAYARQKDYEIAKEVLLDNCNGNLKEEQIQQKFDSDNDYTDFYQSDTYKFNKVSDADRHYYKYSRYKWEDNLSDRSNYVEQRNLFRKNIETTSNSPSSVERQKSQFRERVKEETLEKRDCEIKRENYKKVMKDDIHQKETDIGESKGAEQKINRE